MADDQDSLETTILGVPVKAKGVNVIALVIMALATSGSMFLLWERTNQFVERLQDNSDRLTQEHQRMVESIALSSKVNEKISELIDEQTYVVLSSDAERRAMKEKLRRPPSLTRKLDR